MSEMTPREAMAEAVRLLRDVADELHESHNAPGETTFDGEPEAQAAYEEHERVANSLESAIAARLRGEAERGEQQAVAHVLRIDTPQSALVGLYDDTLKAGDQLYTHPQPAAPAPLAGDAVAELDRIVAGALFDYSGFLTTLDEGVTLGASHEAGVAVELLTKWAAERGLNLDEARVKDWTAALARRVDEVDNGKVIAAARNAWQDSDEARMLANDSSGPVGGKYLRNRLEVAFIAGYDAAVKRLVPEVDDG